MQPCAARGLAEVVHSNKHCRSTGHEWSTRNRIRACKHMYHTNFPPIVELLHQNAPG